MRLSQTKLAATQTKFVFDAHDLFTSITPIKVPFPIGPAKLGPTEGTYEGDVNNTNLESFTDHSDDGDSFRDIVHGNGGFDYFSTGGGNDDITVGSNMSGWHGSGNEFTMGATTVDAGSGDDRIVVDATHGAFHVVTGEGSDTVVVRGGDYVKIDAADGDSQLDTFLFTATFGGTAEIYGADAAWHDQIRFEGGHISEGGPWREIAGGINGTLAMHNDATGGTVLVQGSESANISTHPDWLII